MRKLIIILILSIVMFSIKVCGKNNIGIVNNVHSTYDLYIDFSRLSNSDLDKIFYKHFPGNNYYFGVVTYNGKGGILFHPDTNGYFNHFVIIKTFSYKANILINITWDVIFLANDTYSSIREDNQKNAGGPIFAYIDDNNWIGIENYYGVAVIRGSKNGNGFGVYKTLSKTIPIKHKFSYTVIFDPNTFRVNVLFGYNSYYGWLDIYNTNDYNWNLPPSKSDYYGKIVRIGFVIHRYYGDYILFNVKVKKYARIVNTL